MCFRVRHKNMCEIDDFADFRLQTGVCVCANNKCFDEVKNEIILKLIGTAFFGWKWFYSDFISTLTLASSVACIVAVGGVSPLCESF